MPLTFDFSFDRLQTYQGINPRPADHDEYWAKGLAEMHALDGQVELSPAAFQAPNAECFHLYFTGIGASASACQAAAPQEYAQDSFMASIRNYEDRNANRACGG